MRIDIFGQNFRIDIFRHKFIVGYKKKYSQCFEQWTFITHAKRQWQLSFTFKREKKHNKKVIVTPVYKTPVIDMWRTYSK